MLEKLKKNEIKKYLFNSIWLLTDFLLRMVVGVFVVFYVARYLGPESFGVFSYLLAISTLMIAVSRLGMEAILVREVVRKPKDFLLMIGTAFWMMFLTGLVLYLLVGGTYYLYTGGGQESVYLLIIGGGAMFSSFYVVEFYFQSQVKSKYATICRSIVLILMSAMKLLLIFYEAELFWFFVAALMDFAVLAMVFTFSFWYGNDRKLFLKYFSLDEAKIMLKSAWPLVLVAIALQAYMRTDQLMIRNILGVYEVGIYSAAIRISEAWIIIMGAIAISLLPAIIKLKAGNVEMYKYRLIQLYRLVFWLSLFVATVITFFGGEIIIFIFGEEYSESSSVIGVLMWAAVLSSVGAVSARYYNVEGMEKKFASRTVFSAIVNIILNYIFIPRYGIQGAALATFISAFLANYLLDWFDRDLKILLKIKHKAVLGSLVN